MKIAGETFLTSAAAGDGVAPSANFNWNAAGPGTISAANWALICHGETARSGAGLPFTSKDTPPSTVGRGKFPATVNESVKKFRPYALNSEPGEGETPKLSPMTPFWFSARGA